MLTPILQRSAALRWIRRTLAVGVLIRHARRLGRAPRCEAPASLLTRRVPRLRAGAGRDGNGSVDDDGGRTYRDERQGPPIRFPHYTTPARSCSFLASTTAGPPHRTPGLPLPWRAARWRDRQTDEDPARCRETDAARPRLRQCRRINPTPSAPAAKPGKRPNETKPSSGCVKDCKKA